MASTIKSLLDFLGGLGKAKPKPPIDNKPSLPSIKDLPKPDDPNNALLNHYKENRPPRPPRSGTSSLPDRG